MSPTCKYIPTKSRAKSTARVVLVLAFVTPDGKPGEYMFYPTLRKMRGEGDVEETAIPPPALKMLMRQLRRDKCEIISITQTDLQSTLADEKGQDTEKKGQGQ